MGFQSRFAIGRAKALSVDDADHTRVVADRLVQKRAGGDARFLDRFAV